jgi:magnesium-transporting ATPase (P-type)
MSIPKTTKRPLDSPHGRMAVDVLAALEVSVTTGLSEMEAGHRLRQYGPNTIGRRQRAGAFAVLIHQFQSVVVALLAMAAGLAFYFGEWEEGSAIVGVLALNTLIGFVTETTSADWRASSSFFLEIGQVEELCTASTSPASPPTAFPCSNSLSRRQ